MQENAVANKKKKKRKTYTPFTLFFYSGHQYSTVRKALHSSHPDNLLCREKEIAEIRSFLHNHLPKGKPGSLYISGAPGTGKTACLTEIMIEMKVYIYIVEQIFTLNRQ